MMTSRQRSSVSRALLLAVISLSFAGCGSVDKHDAGGTTAPKGVSGAVPGSLVLNGQDVSTKTGARTGHAPAAAATATSAGAAKSGVPAKVVQGVTPLKPPLLNPNGTIQGSDPFAGTSVQVEPTPIEDDPQANAALTSAYEQLKAESKFDWKAWVHAGVGRVAPIGEQLSATEPADTIRPSLVSIAVEKCGGARQIATGAVLANETVVTTVTAIDNAAKRVWIAPVAGGPRMQGMLQYLDVDDDIAVFRVPGMTLPALPTFVPGGAGFVAGHAYGIVPGGQQGQPQRISVGVAAKETSLTREQPDGFGQQITDRQVFQLIGPIDSGYAGGVVSASPDPTGKTGWGFHGLVRARIPYRSEGGGVVVPARLVNVAVTQSLKLDPWFEIRSGACPNWFRPHD